MGKSEYTSNQAVIDEWKKFKDIVKKRMDHMPGAEKRNLKELSDYILKYKKDEIPSILVPRDKDGQVISPKEKGVTLHMENIKGKIYRSWGIQIQNGKKKMELQLVS